MKRMHQTKTARVLTALAVLLVSAGCAMKGDIRTLQEELRSVAARQDSLIVMLAFETRQTQDTLRTQSNQLFDFRGDIARRLQQIEQSLARLEALAGENQRGMTNIRDQLANMRRGTPTGTQPMTAAGDTTRAGPAGERLVGGGGNADQLWSVARTQYDRGSLNSATRAFDQFISDHANDPRVPDAHFFRADIVSMQNRPRDALAAFQQIQELFPTSPRVPQALYRIAVLHEELGEIDQAKAVLERIVNTYPDDLVFALAREKLREIG